VHVLVIGAGVIGCAVAYELARAGVSVRVIDARGCGRGATHASAGMLAPYIEGHESRVLRRLGQQSLDLFDELIRRLTIDAEERVPYSRAGTIEVARDQMARERLFAARERLVADGVPAEWLDAAALRAVEPDLAPSLLGGLLIPRHGAVAARSLTTALARAAIRHGAGFDEGISAVRIASASGGRVSVHTADARLDADRVVIAAGSWSSHIDIEGEDRSVEVRPIRGQLLQLCLPGHRLNRVIWSSDCYIVPWSDGAVLVGATVEDVGFDERATVEGVRWLLNDACALVPALAAATFGEVRVGLRPATPDDLPLVGASSTVSGLIYATGHFRSGVLLAPLTAQLTRQIVLGQPADPVLPSLSAQRTHRR